MNVVRDPVRTGAGIAEPDAVVLLAQGHLPGADVEQPHFDVERGAGALNGADDDAVRAQFAPAVVGDVVRRLGRRDGAVGVARNHVELALEGEIVPQDFAHQLRRGSRLCVGCQGNEVRHGIVQRRIGFAGDHDIDFGLALGSRRGRLRRILRRKYGDACGARDGSEEKFHFLGYSKLKCTVK